DPLVTGVQTCALPISVKAERVSRLVELQRGVSLKKNRALIGKTVEVLVEGDGKHADQWKARTDGNIVTVFPKGGQAGFQPSEKRSEERRVGRADKRGR